MGRPKFYYVDPALTGDIIFDRLLAPEIVGLKMQHHIHGGEVCSVKYRVFHHKEICRIWQK